MLHLVDVNGDNWVTDLQVSDAQKEYVLDAVSILARAYAYRDEGSRALLICHDDTPVGMALYCDYPELESYELNQFFIDRRYQGHGYGKAATLLILDQMKQEGKYHRAVLWYIEGNDAAKKLYERCGFSETGALRGEMGMAIAW